MCTHGTSSWLKLFWARFCFHRKWSNFKKIEQNKSPAVRHKNFPLSSLWPKCLDQMGLLFGLPRRSESLRDLSNGATGTPHMDCAYSAHTACRKERHENWNNFLALLLNRVETKWWRLVVMGMRKFSLWVKAGGGSGVLQNSSFAFSHLTGNAFPLSAFTCVAGVTLGTQVYSRAG